MNNEPVAWMNSLVKWDIAVEQDITHDIPLYTHPADITDEEYKPLTEADAPYQKVASKEITDEINKALGLKTLTDEEIEQEATVHQYPDWFDSTSFARAILRKAQEK